MFPLRHIPWWLAAAAQAASAVEHLADKEQTPVSLSCLQLVVAVVLAEEVSAHLLAVAAAVVDVAQETSQEHQARLGRATVADMEKPPGRKLAVVAAPEQSAGKEQTLRLNDLEMVARVWHRHCPERMVFMQVVVVVVVDQFPALLRMELADLEAARMEPWRQMPQTVLTAQVVAAAAAATTAALATTAAQEAPAS